ncbi:MAG: acyl-CoA dehydrogenase family protein, partial [Bacteroidota bacterium]
MAETLSMHETTPGGAFLIKETNINDTFIPEEMNEDQRMMFEMAKEFVKNEHWPILHKLEKQEEGLAKGLLQKMGELGLLGSHMPEQFGGMELGTLENTFIAEGLGSMGSFNTTFAAHTGIGMLPILYFGTEDQKEKYLPKLITGEYAAAYCLTEPSSGSDALAAKTTAVLSDDGQHYILNGQKMWISNAGFADIFIVFAKIDGTHFTGFIVEQGLEGFTMGAEEDKMGIKGSSTRQIFFENVKVPADNILGEIGKGHLIAFNALNTGRYKLGNMCAGGVKMILTEAVKYANERHQFKTPISSFGAIKYKIGEGAIKAFALESALYRTAHLMDQKTNEYKANGLSYGDAKLKAAEEYAIESSFLKVLGSEYLSYIADENVQIHGGLGFSEEFSAARIYRDARINRIYEGTNEINRMIMVDSLLKRAMKGRLDLTEPAWAVQKELSSMPKMRTASEAYDQEKFAIEDFKKIFLMVAGAGVKKQMEGNLDLKSEQEILMNIADIMADIFVAESLYLRVKKLANMENKAVDQDVYD